MFVNRRAVTIEWGDCDPLGIVWFPRYFEMFDASTAALFAAALGYRKREMLERFGIAGFPIVDTAAQFLVPGAFGDVIVIESRITRFGRSSFDVEHRLLRGDTLAVHCTEERVWTGRDPENPQRLKGLPIPREVIDRLSSD